MTMIACEGEDASYLYLLGINPQRRIKLNDRTVIEPVSVNPNPDDMIDCVMKAGSQSEVDLGILIATLRLTTAQLVVKADTAEELVAAVWNGQTDAFLLSALLNKEVYWSLQSNMSAESFCANTRISIASPRLLLPMEIADVNEDDCTWLEKHYETAQTLMEDRGFYLAANALWSYRINPRPSAQLAVLWAGIESLFGVQYELSFRVSLLISKLLDTGPEGQRQAKKLYVARSKAVHEGSVKDSSVVSETADLLHGLILECVELGRVPSEQELLFGDGE